MESSGVLMEDNQPVELIRVPESPTRQAIEREDSGLDLKEVGPFKSIYIC